MSMFNFKSKIFLISLFFLISSLVIFPCQILAQEETTETTSEETDESTQRQVEELEFNYDQNSVWQDVNLEDDYNLVFEKYKTSLEDYRREEKAFLIAKDQYQAHKTLESIEEAVKATRLVELERAKVFSHYFNLLKLKLQMTHGVEIKLKKDCIFQLDFLQEMLKVHQEKLEQATDRDIINQLSKEFTGMSTQIQNTSYYALVLLSVGKLQSIHDRSISLYEKIKTEIPLPVNALKKAEKERAFNETKQLLDQSNTVIQQLWLNIDKRRTKKNQMTNLYRTISNITNSVYADLAKSVDYLEELLNK